jgi:hypothetical protein
MARHVLLCLVLGLSGCAADGTFTTSAVGAGSVPGPDWKRVTIQPNGWGATPEAARQDLDRLMDLYAKLPGFQRDDYVAIVPIAKGVYQSDGRCSYLAPPARTATDARPGLRVIPD